jgi:hypothetical protein
MPVFTFEKISPPMRRVQTPAGSAAEKPRSVIVQILDRLVEPRGKRKVGADDKAAQKQPRKSAK